MKRPLKTAPSPTLRVWDSTVIHTSATAASYGARGTDAATVANLKDLYDQILADDEVKTWLQDTMLLEVDTMSTEDVNAHVENVKGIVNEYKDIVAG